MRVNHRSFRSAQAATAFIVLLISALGGCQSDSETVFQGYAEGDFVLVASPLAGQLERLPVSRGELLQSGAPLFALERRREQAAVSAAKEELHRAASQLDDLQKGERPSELQALAARLERARANLDLSGKELARRKNLYAEQSIAAEELDRAMTDFASAQASVDELQAEYQTARLGARSDAIAAARAAVAAAQARLEQAQWELTQKTQQAPQAALVYDTLYEPGEFVPAGYPVVSLLPSGNIKVRFFVPEPLLAELTLGQQIAVSVDGLSEALAATISYISPTAEYTPPVIYSRETRAKLVYMIEARPTPAAAEHLHPGQPVDVRLESSHD